MHNNRVYTHAVRCSVSVMEGYGKPHMGSHTCDGNLYKAKHWKNMHLSAGYIKCTTSILIRCTDVLYVSWTVTQSQTHEQHTPQCRIQQMHNNQLDTLYKCDGRAHKSKHVKNILLSAGYSRCSITIFTCFTDTRYV